MQQPTFFTEFILIAVVFFQNHHAADNSSDVIPAETALQQANNQNASAPAQNTNLITQKKLKRKARRKKLLSNIASRTRQRRIRQRARLRRRRKQKRERARKLKKKQKTSKSKKRKKRPTSKRRKHFSRKTHPSRRGALEQFSKINIRRIDAQNASDVTENSTDSDMSKVYLAIKILRLKNDRRQVRVQQRRGPSADGKQDSIVFEEIDADFGDEDYVFPEDVVASRSHNNNTGMLSRGPICNFKMGRLTVSIGRCIFCQKKGMFNFFIKL